MRGAKAFLFRCSMSAPLCRRFTEKRRLFLPREEQGDELLVAASTGQVECRVVVGLKDQVHDGLVA